MTPPAFIAELVAAVGLLFYATRLEQSREADEAPRIIRPWTVPEKPKRHWFWLKIAMTSCFVAVGAAIAVTAFFGNRPLLPVPKITSPPPSVRAPIPTSTTSSARPKRIYDETRPPKAMDAAEKNTETPRTARPVDIPVPSQPASPLPKFSPVHLEPSIGGVSVRAVNKPAGTLYATIRFSSVSRYRAELDESTTLEAAKAALEKTGNVTVFLGDYSIKSKNRDYSIGGIGPSIPKSVYYFTKDNAAACAAIQSIISGIIGSPMNCGLQELPESSDPNALNIQRDFWLATGLDIEVTI